MKTLIVLSLLACAVNAFGFHDMNGQRDITATNDEICVGQPDGTQIRDPFFCNIFYLCDGGRSIRLQCRNQAPNFDRCTGRCSEDHAVCANTCDEQTTQAPPPPPPPEEETTTVAEVTTTTSRVIPTVPVETTAGPV